MQLNTLQKKKKGYCYWSRWFLKGLVLKLLKENYYVISVDKKNPKINQVIIDIISVLLRTFS